MKRVFQFALALLLLSVEGIGGAQTVWPVNNDVVINMYTGVNNVNRYVDADKTGRLQFLMYGQDPTPGAPVGQLRPQRRVFGPSIVCGASFDSACDVVASAASVTSAQITDASTTGRSVLTASNAATARAAIGAGTSSFDGSYAALTGIPSTFSPSAHTHTAAQISDATGAGRSVLTAPDASAIRSLLSVPSTADIAASYYPLSGNPSGFLTGITSAQVATALGFTPYSAANPSGYIAASALTPYLTTASAASTYATQSALATGLAAKFNVPSGTAAQYLRGDGSTATFPAIPTVPTINRVRATTAADGSYVWTLPTACTSGTTPIVSITPESATANDAISHRIVGTTNSTVTVFAGRSAALTVLSFTVLGIPTGAAVPLHLIAICP